MRVMISIVSLTVGIACLLGCSAEHATDVEDSEASLSEAQPVPGDPWGVCDLNWTCNIPDAGCLGWVEPGSCADEEGDGCEIEGFVIGSLHWCTTSADCPVPLSGDVAPTCNERGECYLACEGGSCPNGYSCVAGPDYLNDDLNPWPPHMCMQAFGPEVVGPGYMPEE